jgi:hypothetical protein
LTHDTQHFAFRHVVGIAFFSQQRAAGPCTFGLTYVNALHAAPCSMQASRHSSGLACESGKFL